MHFSPYPRVILLLSTFVASALVPAGGAAVKEDPNRPFDPSPPLATAASTIQVAPGFKVELLYTVPKAEQGSWVSLAVDPKGRLIAGDQYSGLYRITLPPVGQTSGTRVELLTDKIGGAHGLLHAFDSLYVMVNDFNVDGKPQKGLWRLRDADGDDRFEEMNFLREMKGSGEHGPHALVLSPDGKSIYFANGNHTELPTGWRKSRAVAWGEDHLLRRMWDARGHAKGKFAPGGYIGRIDPEGREVEIFSLGFRNQYDLAFDQNGELFTYDSDMEWDQGSPWYMPTRINHVVDGGDYGWRSGAGRWPDYYADSLPGVLDLGPGSPTGIVFGTHARFPEKYQRALFAADWTYGTMYAVHLTPDGASFRGEKEEFLSGQPLPLTDLLVNPHDGALYFAVGGRRTQSALYRVTYIGNESCIPASLAPPTAAAQLRHSLEALHAEETGPEAIDLAWPHLASDDRFIRYAARVAIEHQPTEKWAERAFAETHPQAAIEALIALARVGEQSRQARLLESLGRLDFNALPAGLQLSLLRAWSLTFTRMGKPSPEICARLAEKFAPGFPHADPFVSRELASLLIYLDSPSVVAKTVPLLSVAEPTGSAPEEMASRALLARNDHYGSVVRKVSGDSRPDRQQIAYAYALRNATTGWTPALREAYFAWFGKTAHWNGGASLGGFIGNIRTEALALVTDPVERARLEKFSQPRSAGNPAPAVVVAPKGPGRAYTVNEAASLVPFALSGRDFAKGKAMFNTTGCFACHRFAGEGSGIGPDLSGAGSRYSIRDLLENIIEPSLVISDQYGSEQLEQRDGTMLLGRVVGEEKDELIVMTNPFAPNETTRVKSSAIKSRKTHPLSMMPPGLINGLNPDELQDLLAYILSAGNPNHPMFRH